MEQQTGAGAVLAGRYRLVEPIGSGGMGKVWRAHDELLHRTVAVKELTAGLYVAQADRDVLHARTQKEARAAARIQHPAVVTVHDVLEHDDRPWIVMEYIDGPSLAEAAKAAGRIEPREAARIGLHVLGALRAAHAVGVLHRDVKPGNVMLAKDGRVLLADFGIAAIEGDSSITRTGELVGSIDYLAPERVTGGAPDPASDLWSLGATLYTAVEARSPFRRTSPISSLQAVVNDEPPALRQSGALGPVITALLRKDPAQRPSATEAERMLLEAMEGREPKAAQAYVPTRAVTARERPGADEEPAAPAGHRQPYGPPHLQGYGPPPAPQHQHQQPHEHEQSHDQDHRHEHSPHQHQHQHQQQQHPDQQREQPQQYPHEQPHAREPRPKGPSEPADGPGSGPGPGPGSGPSAPAPPAGGAVSDPAKGRVRRAAVVALVAALLGGGGVFGVLKYTGDTQGSGADAQGGGADKATSTPDQVPSGDPAKARGEATAPAGWSRVTDPEGFTLFVPDGWKRRLEGSQIDYTPDEGKHRIRIALDRTPDFTSPQAHLLDLESQVRTRLPDYKRQTLRQNTFRDTTRAALWEFTWTEKGNTPGPRRAIEQMYIAADGTEYVVYMSGPVADWATTRAQFDTVLSGWQPAPAPGSPGVATGTR